MTEFSLTCLFVANLVFAAKRLLRYLRYLQQEEYHVGRFTSWIKNQYAFDRRGTLIAVCAAGLIAIGVPVILSNLLGAAALLITAFFEEDPRKQGKVRLKMTPRANRIALAALVLYLLSFIAIAWTTVPDFSSLWLKSVLLFQFIPVYLAAACGILSWDETIRQKKYTQEAKQLLSQVSPLVIGITGSYGKTSTKDALGNLLQATLGPTFWPVKGVNTPMGNTREIRTRLQKGIQYAVFEMGAYGPGSIKRLCELTPPHAAILTCIGIAHLERFGSQETILKAKAELAQAVPSNGILVCNGDNPGTRRIARENPKQHTLLYGFDRNNGPLDCWISSFKTTLQGTLFTVHWKNQVYEGFTPLFGKPALSNAIGAFTMACALGSQPEYALGVIHNLYPVDNRLQVQTENSITYLKDAYNSNPIGFAAALEVMADLPGKQRILMTPGIIELGPQQYSENEQVGKKAAQVCDFTIIVGKTNKEALSSGLRAGGMSDNNIIFCQTREQAFTKLNALAQPGDLVLIENDLTDLYEVPARF